MEKDSFRKRFSFIFAVLFTFTSVSNCFPPKVHAQVILPGGLETTDEEKLNNEILFLLEHVERICDEFRQNVDTLKHAEFKKIKSDFAGIEKGKTCLKCHSSSKQKTSKDRFPLLSLESMMEKLLPPLPKHSVWSHLSPSQKWDQASLDIKTAKTKLEHYLALKNLPVDLHMSFIKTYIVVLTQYLVVSLMTDSLKNPFDTLDKDFGLTLSPLLIYKIQKALSTLTGNTTKGIFTTMVYFKHDRMFFTDNFKINIELSSYLRSQTEAAWLNILKLETVRYLGEELLKITDYWPEVGNKNKEFFGILSRHFRSMNHNFGSLIESKEYQKNNEFNVFFANDMIKKQIPPILSVKRYQEIINHTPKLKEIIGDGAQDYVTKTHIIENETLLTGLKLKNAIEQQEVFSLRKYSPQEQTYWLRDTILSIKKEYLHKHLLRHFLEPREITPADLTELEKNLINDYNDELSFECVYVWVSEFQSPQASQESSGHFQKLILMDIPHMVLQIEEIDNQIQAILLHEFNKSASYTKAAGQRYGYPDLPLGAYWTGVGMDNEEMSGALPPSFDFPELLKTQDLPKVSPIDNDTANFSALKATLLLPLQGSLLFKKLSELTNVQTKEDLLKTHESIVEELKKLLTASDINQHEKDMLFHTQKALQKLGEELKKLDIKNTQTLDDFFSTPKEKVEFLKAKKKFFLNFFRMLSLPVHSGEEKPFLKHLQDLKKEDGFLLSQVKAFLKDQKNYIDELYETTLKENSFPAEDLSHTFDYRFEPFYTAYQEKIEEFLPKDLISQKNILYINETILMELQTLKEKIKKDPSIPPLAYEHPEYFIQAPKNSIPSYMIDNLKRVQELRQQRKKMYLDKGGNNLDQWIQSYLRAFLTRQVLIKQDLLLRKNIFKVTAAKSIEEIKEFVLDPYILSLAIERLQKEEPNQTWRIAMYQKIHMDLVKDFSHTILNTYFEASAHSIAVWSAIVATLILTFLVPGGQLFAYGITMLLLADAFVQSGHELYESFYVLPKVLNHKKDFYYSSVGMMEQKGAPGSLEELEHMEKGLALQKAIVIGTTVVLVLPWAYAEVKNGIRLFHSQTNWFTSLKIPLYAKNLGVDSAQGISLSAVRKKLAEKLNVSVPELLHLEEKELLKAAIAKLGKKEGELFSNMFKFFHDPQTARTISMTQVERFGDALKLLGIEKVDMSLLSQARENAKALLIKNAQKIGLPTISKELEKILLEERTNIREAVRFLESNPEIPYILNPRLALQELGLSANQLPKRREFEELLRVLPTGDPQKKAAWEYLRSLYDMTYSDLEQLSIQSKILSENNLVDKEAWDALQEIFTGLKKVLKEN